MQFLKNKVLKNFSYKLIKNTADLRPTSCSRYSSFQQQQQQERGKAQISRNIKVSPPDERKKFPSIKNSTICQLSCQRKLSGLLLQTLDPSIIHTGFKITLFHAQFLFSFFQCFCFSLPLKQTHTHFFTYSSSLHRFQILLLSGYFIFVTTCMCTFR